MKNQAEYMRTRRAAAKTPRDTQECALGSCHVSFVPQRSDARFCSDACRAADRRGRHTVCAWQFAEGGWWLAGSTGAGSVLSADNFCAPLPGDGQCLEPAVWARQFFNHHTPHLIGGERFCAGHKPQTERLRKVVEIRDGWLSGGAMFYAQDPR
jgi:hypothetical protein